MTAFSVMAGLVPAIHVVLVVMLKTWMPGTRPGMTRSTTKALSPLAAFLSIGSFASAAAQPSAPMMQGFSSAYIMLCVGDSSSRCLASQTSITMRATANGAAATRYGKTSWITPAPWPERRSVPSVRCRSCGPPPSSANSPQSEGRCAWPPRGNAPRFPSSPRSRRAHRGSSPRIA
jgi:hypothetical protein